MSRILFLFSCLSLVACGQTGPLYLPPTCSPVAADGTVRTITGEDGEALPPCPPPEAHELGAPVEGEDETPDFEDDELNQDY